MKFFRYCILAIREAGVHRFVTIAAVKVYRRLAERHIDNRVSVPRRESVVLFNGLLPLEQSTAQRFKAAFPAAFTNLIALSQRIRSHRFQLLGVSFDFGEKILWSFDPVSATEWKKKAFTERSIHYDGSPSDVRPLWELNRCQHFVTLAQAYYCSGDRTYADELVAQWLDWIKENPYRAGINWASPLEIAIRLISWSIAFQFVEHHLSREDRSSITWSVWQQASYLSSHLSIDKIVRTNHLIGEAAGLYIAASCFAFNTSSRWMARSQRILEEEIQSQIFSDGVGKEQSASYHRFDVDVLLLAYVRGRRLPAPFSVQFGEKLQKMVRWLFRYQTPNYQLPNFGDSDNGRGFLLAPSVDFWDARGLIAAAGAALEFNDVPIEPFLNEESFWLLDERKWKSAKEKVKIPLVEKCIVSWESGHIILTDAESDRKDYCFFRAGPFGMGGNGFSSHSHNDLFSPILYMNRECILADSGTSVYLGNDIERDYLRSAKAHNTSSDSGWDYFQTRPGFGWKRALNGKVIRRLQTDHEIAIECGFEDSGGPRYRRTIVYRPSDQSFSIEDRFDASARGVHSYFHLAAGLTIERDGSHFLLLKGHRAIVRFTVPNQVTSEIEVSWISNSYGTKEKALLIHGMWDAVAKEPALFSFARIRE